MYHEVNGIDRIPIIYSYLDTSGGQSFNLYLNIVHFFNTSVNKTSVADWDSCFPALVPNMCCSIVLILPFNEDSLSEHSFFPLKGIKSSLYRAFYKITIFITRTCGGTTALNIMAEQWYAECNNQTLYAKCSCAECRVVAFHINCDLNFSLWVIL